MAKSKKVKKLNKALRATYRKLATDLLARLERDNPERRVAFLVHDDALVEPGESKKYVWVDAKVLVRVKREKRGRLALAPVAEAATA